MLAFITWNPSPNIFSLGFFTLKWYSLLFLLGFVISYQLLQPKFKRAQRHFSLLDRLTIYVFIGTLAGARLGDCLFYDFSYYRHHIAEIFLPVVFSPTFRFTGYAGLASHGGALGILSSVWFFSRKYHINYLWTLDQLALVVPLAGTCIRLGNLMNSEIIGKPATIPWAFVFVRDDLIPRHPAQLYESVAYLLIFFIMSVISKNFCAKPGFLFGCFLTMLFSARFIIEFFKEDQVAFESHLAMNMGQLLSVPLIIAGLIIILIKYERRIAD